MRDAGQSRTGAERVGEDMINRSNYAEVKRYLKYLSEVRQNSEKTLRKRWAQLRHLLEWADERPLPEAPRIRPAFPQYLLTARNDGQDEGMSFDGMKAVCGTAKRFFRWARTDNAGSYRAVTVSWIDTLVPPRVAGSEPNKREVFDLDAVRAILALEPETLTLKRDQAAVAFLFLSGMRVGAFVTTPISCIDVGRRTVKQWPSKGVRTKNSKAATTHLLDIPDLLQTVQEWDSLVRENLPATALWYASLSTDGMRFTAKSNVTVHRATFLARGIRRLCEAADVPYLSPHKLRHGHAVYGIERAQTVGDLKAVSQNLMHSSLVITDGIYGGLTQDETAERIAALTAKENGEKQLAQPDVIKQLEAILAQLKTASENGPEK